MDGLMPMHPRDVSRMLVGLSDTAIREMAPQLRDEANQTMMEERRLAHVVSKGVGMVQQCGMA